VFNTITVVRSNSWASVTVGLAVLVVLSCRISKTSKV